MIINKLSNIYSHLIFVAACLLLLDGYSTKRTFMMGNWSREV